MVIGTAILYLFCHNEIKYSLPTLVPKNYHPAESGNSVKWQNKFFGDSDKPTFIHCINPGSS